MQTHEMLKQSSMSRKLTMNNEKRCHCEEPPTCRGDEAISRITTGGLLRYARNDSRQAFSEQVRNDKAFVAAKRLYPPTKLKLASLIFARRWAMATTSLTFSFSPVAVSSSMALAPLTM